eukprot:gene13099-14440_t
MMKSMFIDNKDTFAILPTGHWKSLPYQIAPLVARKLYASGPSNFAMFRNRKIVLVISPLLAIMEIQVKELNDAGIPACCLHDEKIIKDDVLDAKYFIIFGSPEAWIRNKMWRNMLISKTYQKGVLLIVADEAHCIPKW